MIKNKCKKVYLFAHLYVLTKFLRCLHHSDGNSRNWWL